jgi:hypothetical protein
LALSDSTQQQTLKLQNGLFLAYAFNHGYLSGKPVKRGGVKLPLAVALLRVCRPPTEIACCFSDGDDITRFDLGFKFSSQL